METRPAPISKRTGINQPNRGRRPTTSLSLSRATIAAVREVADRLGITQVEVFELCLSDALPRYAAMTPGQYHDARRDMLMGISKYTPTHYPYPAPADASDAE